MTAQAITMNALGRTEGAPPRTTRPRGAAADEIIVSAPGAEAEAAPEEAPDAEPDETKVPAEPCSNVGETHAPPCAALDGAGVAAADTNNPLTDAAPYVGSLATSLVSAETGADTAPVVFVSLPTVSSIGGRSDAIVSDAIV